MAKKMYPEYRIRASEIVNYYSLSGLTEEIKNFAENNNVNIEEIYLSISGDYYFSMECMVPETPEEKQYRLNVIKDRKTQRRVLYENLKKEFG